MGGTAIFMLLFCFACASLHARDYTLSLMLENGDFKFFVMRNDLWGHVRGIFRGSERKRHCLPPAHVTVTLEHARTCLHRLQSADGTAVLQIDHLFINIGSDRKIFLCTVPHWSRSNPENDRVFIYVTSDTKHGFDVNCKNVRSQVSFRNINQGFEITVPPDSNNTPSRFFSSGYVARNNEPDD